VGSSNDLGVGGDEAERAVEPGRGGGGGWSECIGTRRLSQTAEQHSASVNRSIHRLIDRHFICHRSKAFVAYSDKQRGNEQSKQYGGHYRRASRTILQTADRVSRVGRLQC
jgi:hypothetical protein